MVGAMATHSQFGVASLKNRGKKHRQFPPSPQATKADVDDVRQRGVVT